MNKKSTTNYDAAIIGGGAAGLAAAVTYLRRQGHGSLLLLEANDACGKKLLASGNGRCNISNSSALHYPETKSFFESIGIPFRLEEGGRVYPMSGQAVSVRDALTAAAACEGIETRYSARVSSVSKTEDFSITLEDGTQIKTARLLIATGGKAGPQYGCYGDGYKIARSLGHTAANILPALVPLVYTDMEKTRLACLKGLRARARAKLQISGRTAAASEGEVQFTDYGLSGIMIFDLTAPPQESINTDWHNAAVVLDFAPGTEAKALEKVITANEGFWLEGVVGKKLSALLVAEGRENISQVAALAKSFSVSVRGTKGWKEAQTTAGGVRLSEIDGSTGESLLCKGLFFAGEILEPVFTCGGYNLDYAWSTGIRAGMNL